MARFNGRHGRDDFDAPDLHDVRVRRPGQHHRRLHGHGRGGGQPSSQKRESDSAVESGSGTVKWFNTERGYGFIQPHRGGRDVHVHMTEVERAGRVTLREGQTVSYDIRNGRQGKPSAINLRFE